jgi:hypothetical protein
LPPAKLIALPLAGGIGNFADFPGPPAGFVRFYDVLNTVADALAAPLVNVVITFRPGNYVVQPAQSGASSFSSNLEPMLVEGESFRVTNGGATSGRIQATYHDLPATGFTAIRQLLSAVATTVIAAPTGNVSRSLVKAALFGNSLTVGLPLRLVNLDSVAHSFEVLLGGVLLSRSPVANAGTVGALLSPTDLAVTEDTGDLAVRTSEAVVTTPPILIASSMILPTKP